ncbi:MAG: hypothetical protein V4699_03540 [Patescibacteria group bacterium]
MNKEKMDFDPRPFPQGGRPPEFLKTGDKVKRVAANGKTIQIEGTILEVKGLELLVRWDTAELKDHPEWINTGLVRKQ